jgi:hypothetical protein
MAHVPRKYNMTILHTIILDYLYVHYTEEAMLALQFSTLLFNCHAINL